MRRLGAALLASLAAATLAAAAPDPGERLPDPGQEARARRLMQDFRCVVCQNESIDDSEADLAGDLRRSIREQVRAGASDAAIHRFMENRYGEFILLKPRFSLGNAALWLTPPGILLVAGSAVLLLRRRRTGQEHGLTEEEEARLAQIGATAAFDTLRPNIGLSKTGGLTET